RDLLQSGPCHRDGSGRRRVWRAGRSGEARRGGRNPRRRRPDPPLTPVAWHPSLAREPDTGAWHRNLAPEPGTQILVNELTVAKELDFPDSGRKKRAVSGAQLVANP